MAAIRGRAGRRVTLDPSTLAVSLGRPHGPGAPVNPPIGLSSTYRLGGDTIYGRDDSPTWSAFEEVLGGLEGGRALTFSSGMAAIAAVLGTVAVGGIVVAPRGAYNGTRRLLGQAAQQGRLTVRSVDISNTEETVSACEDAALLWLESPTNPQLAIADICALAPAAQMLGAAVVADNTFATPLLQRPLDMGADVVVHSVTKYLGGHSDLLMGAVVTRDDEWFDNVLTARQYSGAIPGSLEAFLALRGLRTLPVRLARAQETAGELAARLTLHPEVERVRYPGLPEHPGHDIAKSQMRGFGAMVSFDVVGGAPAADAVCEAVKLLVPATSLGGVETSIERRGRYVGEENTPPGLLRMSVGLEHVDDLWADLEQALAAVNR